MTRLQSTDVPPTRRRSSHVYAAPYPTRRPARPVRRATVFPWWIWAVGPAATVGVVFAVLQVR